MEAGEVTKYQQVASAAQLNLEEANNKVRVLSTELQAAQMGAQAAATNAQKAQKDLAEHDKKMYDSRQKASILFW